MPEYAPIDSDQRMPSSDQSYVEILPSTVYTKLSKLYPSKASGPNEISCWSLKIYTDILAHLISRILNSSFEEGTFSNCFIPLAKGERRSYPKV